MRNILAAIIVSTSILAWAPNATALPDPPIPPGPGCNMAQLTKAINDRPRDAVAWTNRADCLLMTAPGQRRPPIRNLEAAIKDLEHARQLDPRNWVIHHNMGHAASYLLYEDLAIYEFSEAIKLNPRSAESYAGRGWAYFDSCNLKQAVVDFNHAVSLDASTRPRTPTNPRLAQKQEECLRPLVVPDYVRIGPQADPYFDHNSDYWKNRRWEERPHP